MTQKPFILPEKFKPTCVIYHNVALNFPCPDGLAAAWVVNKRYPGIECVGCTYQEIVPEISSQHQDILVVDFSLPIEVLREWKLEGRTVYIIDHHKSFKENISTSNAYSFDNLIFDENESGATLAWKILFSDSPVPLFLQYVRDRDLFKKVLPYSDEIHCGMGKLGRSFSLYDQLEYLPDEVLLDWLIELGTPSLNKKYAKITKYLTKTEFWDSVPVVTLNKSDVALKSDLGEFVCKYHPFSRFCVILVNGMMDDVRLRSSETVWNTDLIGLFQDSMVNGHRNACSFKWTQSRQDLKQYICSKNEYLMSSVLKSQSSNTFDLLAA